MLCQGITDGLTVNTYDIVNFEKGTTVNLLYIFMYMFVYLLYLYFFCFYSLLIWLNVW